MKNHSDNFLTRNARVISDKITKNADMMKERTGLYVYANLKIRISTIYKCAVRLKKSLKLLLKATAKLVLLLQRKEISVNILLKITTFYAIYV